MSWATLRREIYARDGGICRACGMRVSETKWDAGHLQDRIDGGQDCAENVVVMCIPCNRSRKPRTATQQEALDWMDMQTRPPVIDWRPVWELASGKTPDVQRSD